MNQLRHELPKALRGIAPQVGSIWEWMPLTEARETLVVTDVMWNGEACFVTSRRFGDLSANPKTFPNELSRWVEATVFLREADAPVVVHFSAEGSLEAATLGMR